MNNPHQATVQAKLAPHAWRHVQLTSPKAALLRHATLSQPSQHFRGSHRALSRRGYACRQQNRSSAAEAGSTSTKPTTEELVDDLLQRIQNSGQTSLRS